MPWVRISDDYSEHAKLRALPAPAIAMWLAGIAYANRNLTDGTIPARVTAGLIDTSNLHEKVGGRYREITASAVIRALILHGLWHETGHDCDACPQPLSDLEYVIHDYLDYQPAREKVLVEREKTRIRVERHRASRSLSSETGNAVTSGATNARVTRAPKSQSQELPRHDESSHDSYADSDVTDSTPSTEFLRRFAAQTGLTDVPAIVDRVRARTGISISGDRAIGLSRWILEKSPKQVRAAQSYVLRTIDNSAAEIEQHIYGGAA